MLFGKLQADLKKLSWFKGTDPGAVDRQGKETVGPDFSFLQGSTDPFDGHDRFAALVNIRQKDRPDCIRSNWPMRAGGLA